MKRSIHYAGAMQVQLKGWFKIVLPGWAACCAGPEAEKIREYGNHSYNKQRVTCGKCKRLIALEEEYLRKKAEATA